MRDIFQKLGLKTDLEKEKDKFIKRMQVVLDRIQNELFFTHQGSLNTIKIEIPKILGEDKKEQLKMFISNQIPFEENLMKIMVMLKVFDNITESYAEDFNDEIIECMDLSVIDLGYLYKNGEFLEKGAKEIDEALIKDILDWLEDYPTTEKQYKAGLKKYFKKDFPGSITDCYSALESLVKTFLKNNQNLKKNKKLLVKSLRLPKQWVSIIFHYCDFANDFSSRHGKKETDKKQKPAPLLVEAFIYQTGLIMRLIIRSKE